MESNETSNSTSREDAASHLFTILGEYIPLAVEINGIIGTSFLLATLVLQHEITKIPVPINIALCSLLVVDLLYLTLAVSDDIFYDFIGRPLYNMSEFACYSVIVLLSTFASLQGYIQCIISVERVMAIVVPFKVKFLVTRARISGAISLVALMLLSIRIAYAVFGYEFHGGMCSIRGYRKDRRKSLLFLAIFDSVVYLAIPSSVLFICTCFIVVFLLIHRKRPRSRSRNKMLRNDIRLSLILVVMNILFICTSLPYNIDLYSHTLQKKSDETPMSRYHKIPAKLTRLAGSTDWLILISLSSPVRHAAKELICNRRSRL